MKRTWTIIGVADVPRSFAWYQTLFGQPLAQPFHPDFAQVRLLPWWVVVGGVLGVVFVAGSVIVGPTLGIALFFVCVVAGQLLGATIVDQLGAFGLPQKPVNVMKLIGLGLVLVGAALVQRSGR